MALIEYLGAITLQVDGVEMEVQSLDVTSKTGRKLVKTMNSTGRAKGFCRGISDFELKLTVVVPLSGDPDWASIEGSKVTVYPQLLGGVTRSYQDCFTTEVGAKYTVDNEAVRDITMNSLREVVE